MKNVLFILSLLFSFNLFSKTYSPDLSKSTVKWNGKKVAGEHFGQVKISKGELTLEGTDIKNGTIEIDMSSITCEDLENPKYNKKLVDHLKSGDFFSTDQYPKAIFKITDASLGKGGHYDVTGDMTIKGITKPVQFKAQLSEKKGKITYKAQITLDRTKWDIKYKSKSFFEELKDNFIYDEFTLDVTLVLNK